MRNKSLKVLAMASLIVASTGAMQAAPALDQKGLPAAGREAGERGRGCSNASLRGSFGFTAQGTLLALPPPFAGPFGEVGRQTFDGAGNTEATGTLSSNGNIFRVTVQGTYVVNPDCTGSMTLYILPFGTTANFDLVVDDDGAEVRAIASDAGEVETRGYTKQF